MPEATQKRELLVLAARLAAELVALHTELQALEAQAPEPTRNGHEHDDLLTVAEVAEALRVTREQVHSLSRRADWQRFTVRISRKNTRFQRAGFERWVRRRATDVG